MKHSICPLCMTDIDKHIKGDVIVLTLQGNTLTLHEYLYRKSLEPKLTIIKEI